MLGIAVVAWLVWERGGSEVLGALGAIPAWRLLAMLPINGVAIAVDAWGWWLTLPTPRSARYRDLLGIELTYLAPSLLPAARIVMATEALYVTLLRRRGVDLVTSVSSVYRDKLARSAAKLLFVAGGIGLVTATREVPAAAVAVAWAGLLAAGAALAALITLPAAGPRPTGRPAGALGRGLGVLAAGLDGLSRCRRPGLRAIGRRLERGRAVGLRAIQLHREYFRRSAKFFWWSTAAHLAAHLVGVLEGVAILNAFGVPATVPTAAGVWMAEALVSVVIEMTRFMPAGLGSMEAGLAGAFPLAGLPEALALPYALTLRAYFLAWFLVSVGTLAHLIRARPRGWTRPGAS